MTLSPTPSSPIGIQLAPPDEGDATPRGGTSASAPVIKDLMGLAEASGKLKLGDRLVAVNGVDVADQPSAAAEMRKAAPTLTLRVERKSELKMARFTSRTRTKSNRVTLRATGGNTARPITVVRHVGPPVYEETAHPADSVAVELPEVEPPPEVGHVVLVERGVEELDDDGGGEVEPPPEVRHVITMERI